ncbi:MAG TPA: hypothetical protein VGA42_04465 [Gemmatimonadales bacterium]
MALAVALSAGTYLGLEHLGRRGLFPAGCRAAAWGSVGLLVLNPGCPAPGVSARPVVLLDGSLSLTAAGGRWAEARRAATALGGGEVRLFGDPDRVLDSVPVAGVSRLAPSLAAAAASGRPIIVVSDGEISDRADLPPDLLRRVGVRLFPRLGGGGPAVALRRLEGPERITPVDTLELEVEVVAVALPDTIRSVRLEARAGDRVLARAVVRLDGGSSGHTVLRVPPGALPPGEHVLSVAMVDTADAEPRDNARLHVVTVSRTPGVVIAASPPDWDSRFLYRALREVSDLPVLGFVQLEPGRWRRMTDLVEVAAAEVRQEMAGADLTIRFGPDAPRESGARALWEWVGAGAGMEEGDWYFDRGAASPVTAALAAAPVDSFPPATGLAAGELPDAAWIGLVVKLGRRGADRPALAGWEEAGGGRRTVIVWARGLWRWAFRGGAGEQAYRALVAATVDWLLAAHPPEQGRVRALRRVTPAGRPLLFGWIGGGEPEPVPVRFQSVGDGPPRTDTLRFDASGVAAVHLEPGVYTYGVEGRAQGTVAVETYSEEWFPRPIVLEQAEPTSPAQSGERRPREEPWLYLLAVAAFAAEWAVRRRMGLR